MQSSGGNYTPWQFSDANTGQIPEYSTDESGEYTSAPVVDPMGASILFL